ncbi:MAG: ATP-binding protein [Opitutales bacterium]
MKKIFKLSLFARVLLSILSISAIIIVVLSCASYVKLEEIHLEGKKALLSQSADDIKILIDANGINEEIIYKAIKKDATIDSIRTTIVKNDGSVIYDSNANFEEMVNHLDRPEIKKALSGEENFIIRFSDTTKESFLYIATYAGKYEDGSYQYCIRQAISIDTLSKEFKKFCLEIIAFILLTILLAGILSFLVAREISMPLKKLNRLAQSYEEANFNAKVTESTVPEINKLARSMQSMAQELKLRINSLNKRNSELDEIFEQMTQIIFICDSDGRILRMNQAGTSLLNIKDNLAHHKIYLNEVIRNTPLLNAINDSFNQGEKLSIQLEYEDRNYILQSKILPYDSPKKRVLCVLHDITHISANETLRREFVSSVSHELKTPITAIQMAAETIQECDSKEERENFLDMINKETLRMNNLVDDMLLLSKIEYAENTQLKEFESHNLKSLLEEAISYNEFLAHSKNMDICLECPKAISIKCDETLIKLAFSNLINNSIKYGNENSLIEIEILDLTDSIVLKFRDSSIGINKEDLERIFERFYRVNKGRSRNLGGTGLGLAIVKHIIKLHSGSIELSSKIGVGSTFTITLNK